MSVHLVLEVGGLVDFVAEVVDLLVDLHDALPVALVLLLVVYLLDEVAQPALDLRDHVVLALIDLQQVQIVRRLQRVHYRVFVNKQL